MVELRSTKSEYPKRKRDKVSKKSQRNFFDELANLANSFKFGSRGN
jgi:hypothetical protein